MSVRAFPIPSIVFILSNNSCEGFIYRKNSINLRTMNKKASKVIKYLLSFVLAAVLVFFAFRTVDWAAFMADIRQTRWVYVMLFFVASVLALVFREERWRILLQEFDPDMPRLTVWNAINVSNMVNIVLPGAGEILRFGYVKTKKMNAETALGTIVCERAFDVLAILLIFVIALACFWDFFGSFFMEQLIGPLKGGLDFSLWWIVAVVVLLLAGYFVLTLRLEHRSSFFAVNARVIRNVGAGIASIARIKRKFAFVANTLGIWLMYLLMSYFMLLAVPDLSQLNLVDALFISGVGNIASVVPVPGGIGAYHYLVALCIQTLYGVTWETGIVYATLSHELHALLVIVLGVISYFGMALRKRK